MQTTVLGSTPNGTFCTCTGRFRSAAASFRASSVAFFSRSRAAFSAALRFSSALPPALRFDVIWAICFWATAPFLFFMPNVRSSTILVADGFLPPGALSFFFGGMGGTGVVEAKRSLGLFQHSMQP